MLNKLKILSSFFLFLSCVNNENVDISIVKNEIHQLKNANLELNVTVNFTNKSKDTLSIYLESKELLLKNESTNYKNRLLLNINSKNVFIKCVDNKITENCKEIYDSIATTHYYRITGDKNHYKKKQLIENSIRLKSLETKSFTYQLHINNSYNETDNLIAYLEKNPTYFNIELYTIIKKGPLTLTAISVDSIENNFIKLSSKQILLNVKQLSSIGSK